MHDEEQECPFCGSHDLTIQSKRDNFGRDRVETVCSSCERKITAADFRDNVNA